MFFSHPQHFSPCVAFFLHLPSPWTNITSPESSAEPFSHGDIGELTNSDIALHGDLAQSTRQSLLRHHHARHHWHKSVCRVQPSSKCREALLARNLGPCPLFPTEYFWFPFFLPELPVQVSGPRAQEVLFLSLFHFCSIQCLSWFLVTMPGSSFLSKIHLFFFLCVRVKSML